MKLLLIIDQIEKLNQEWDNSLLIGGEMLLRGHEVRCAGVSDLWAENDRVFARSKRLIFKPKNEIKNRFFTDASKIHDAESFDLILIRKEPPVDESYLTMTYLLEMIAGKVKVMNHPRGIRNANEKLWTLRFPKWIPKTLVSADPRNISKFRSAGGSPVIKPLNQKGGKDVFILKSQTTRMKEMTQGGKKFIMAQERLQQNSGAGEKRIVLLNGNFFCAYLKKPKKGEFRANLDLGADFVPTELTLKEKRLIRELRPFLKKEGLDFVGLDVLQEKLLEVNVTCPAGVSESSFLHPRAKLFSVWADFLERSVSS